MSFLDQLFFCPLVDLSVFAASVQTANRPLSVLMATHKM